MIQHDWQEFFVASVGVGTASKEARKQGSKEARKQGKFVPVSRYNVQYQFYLVLIILKN